MVRSVPLRNSGAWRSLCAPRRVATFRPQAVISAAHRLLQGTVLLRILLGITWATALLTHARDASQLGATFIASGLVVTAVVLMAQSTTGRAGRFVDVALRPLFGCWVVGGSILGLVGIFVLPTTWVGASVNLAVGALASMILFFLVRRP